MRELTCEHPYIGRGLCKFVLDGDGDGGVRMRALCMDRDAVIESETSHLDAGDPLIDILAKNIDKGLRSDVGDLFDGSDFLSSVREGGITDFDGVISAIYVNGYSSNLGLFSDSFDQGKFSVSEGMFERICRDYKVEVVFCGR